MRFTLDSLCEGRTETHQVPPNCGIRCAVLLTDSMEAEDSANGATSSGRNQLLRQRVHLVASSHEGLCIHGGVYGLSEGTEHRRKIVYRSDCLQLVRLHSGRTVLILHTECVDVALVLIVGVVLGDAKTTGGLIHLESVVALDGCKGLT